MRKAGILMHITSLPGPYGVGTMGKNAYAFLDFLHKSGQQSWQMLPLGTGTPPTSPAPPMRAIPILLIWTLWSGSIC